MVGTYASIKYLYDTDSGKQLVKRQRAYYQSDNVTFDTVITPLFVAREVTTDLKVTGTDSLTRHVIVEINNRSLRSNIPYRPHTDELNEHILEILNAPNVDCGDYFGETIKDFDSFNSI